MEAFLSRINNWLSSNSRKATKCSFVDKTNAFNSEIYHSMAFKLSNGSGRFLIKDDHGIMEASWKLHELLKNKGVRELHRLDKWSICSFSSPKHCLSIMAQDLYQGSNNSCTRKYWCSCSLKLCTSVLKKWFLRKCYRFLTKKWDRKGDWRIHLQNMKRIPFHFGDFFAASIEGFPAKVRSSKWFQCILHRFIYSSYQDSILMYISEEQTRSDKLRRLMNLVNSMENRA